MKRHLRTLKAILVTVMLALLGGIVFCIAGLPVPWLLGPMASTLAGSLVGLRLYWPSKLRDAALVIVGYSLGLSFTGEAVGQISSHLLSIMMMTILLIGYCSLVAVIVAKLSGVDYQSVLLGSIPGGLSQMITLSEEIKETDSSVVTIFQVTRLLLIIFIVPFIAVTAAPNFKGVPNISESVPTDMFPSIFVFAPLAVLFAILGKKVKLPTAFLTGPLLITAILTATGIEGPALPGFVLDLSQFLIGAHLGLMFKKESFASQGARLAWALVSGVLLLAGATTLAFLLKAVYRMDFITSYLSMAPGGMDQMSIIGHETGADLSIIAGYQLFRLFFIFFALPYLIKGLFYLLGNNKS